MMRAERHSKSFYQKRYKKRHYALRQSVRCPKKYGNTILERKLTLAPSYDLEPACEQIDLSRPLDMRYKKNAAVIPDIFPSCSSSVVTREESISISPVEIHGFSVADYQQVYHAVVDPLLFSPSGKPRAYSLELGRTIKENLFQELSYPLLQSTENSNEKVEVTEKFCLLRPTPRIDVDCKVKLRKRFL